MMLRFPALALYFYYLGLDILRREEIIEGTYCPGPCIEIISVELDWTGRGKNVRTAQFHAVAVLFLFNVQ